MKIIKALVIGLSIFYCSMTFAQSRDISVKLKHGLPNILKVSNVRVYSDSHISQNKYLGKCQEGQNSKRHPWKRRLDFYSKNTWTGLNLSCRGKIL